jgi:flagellar hook-associated protein 1 FlgK
MSFETRPSSGGLGQIEVFTRDTTGAEVPLVDKQMVVSNVSFTGSAFQAGSPPADLALSTGTLNTQLDARDGFTQSVRDDLATLANQVRLGVNAAYNPSGTGQDFFAPGSGGKLIELASGMTASTLTATATGDAGANELANAVASVASKKFSTTGGDLINGTLSGSFSLTVARVGDSLKTVENQLQDQQLTESLALSLRDQVSGVSLDEETANLMNYQRAFQASARFITTIDSMLDTVVNQMGR